MFITEKHFKNEDGIKSKIVEAHRRGVCDRNGKSIKVTDAIGGQRVIAKPRFSPSSVVKTYVCRDGKVVLKNG